MSVTHLRVYVAGRHGARMASLWTGAGVLVARAHLRTSGRPGWRVVSLRHPVRLDPGTSYVVGYRLRAGGRLALTKRYFRGPRHSSGPLTATSGVIGHGSRARVPQRSTPQAYFADVVARTARGSGGTAEAGGASGAPYTPLPISQARPANCAAAPSSCGYADSTNTGIATGTRLRSVPGDVSSGAGWHYDNRGWVSVDGDGAVLAGLAIGVPVEVFADGVTIRDSRITVTGQGWGVGLRHATNVAVVRNDISSPAASGPDRLMVGVKDVYGDSTGVLVAANDISHASTGVQLTSGTVVDNYIHDLAMTGGDHVNGFSSNGSAGPLVLRHNTILNQIAQTDAIALFPDFGSQRDAVISDNLLGGGGYTVYGGYDLGKGNGPSANIVIRNNRITRQLFSGGGYYGWLAHYNPHDPGNALEGNYWDDSINPAT